MDEPINDNPKAPKRSSKRKPAMEPLGWDEIVSQPGMGGYLSFLNGPVPLPHLQPSTPELVPDPEPVIAPAAAPTPRPTPTPVVVSGPERRLRIRKCQAAHDGHSLGEEVLYQALWQAAAAEPTGTRIIIIGWRGMSQLCRMTPKNCKINTQRLLRKLAIEVLSPYNTPESIGTTYRVYSNEAILQRRRAAGMEWVVRSRGVEFVDPATGSAVTAQLCSNASK